MTDASSPIELRGLRMESPQTLGAIRLVPIVRERVSEDLRLAMRRYDSYGVVSVDRHRPEEVGIKYVSFVPHGFVVSYTDDGSVVAALGASFGAPSQEKKGRFVRLMHRMVKAERGQGNTGRVRLLPLHLAMEGYLALHFRGPDIAWSEYSKQAIRHGLDPRIEHAMPGTWLDGYEEATRTFEILPNQVGVLVFVAEAMASAFVVPHPDDYRALHRSLLDDYLGDLLFHYAALHVTPSAWARLDTSSARSIADLRREVERTRAAWREYGELLASGLLERDIRVETVRTMGAFRLERFLPVFDPDVECHIGERIVRVSDGELEYLKTFRLSGAQIRRAYLLSKLASVDFHLESAAALLESSVPDLVRRIANAGFSHLFRAEVLAEALRSESRRS